jgi:hypothetical protein
VTFLLLMNIRAAGVRSKKCSYNCVLKTTRREASGNGKNLDNNKKVRTRRMTVDLHKVTSIFKLGQ